MLNILGHLHSFEPWVKQVKWDTSVSGLELKSLKCISLDKCNVNPCKNDATCYNGLTDYHCDCKCGWKGKDCNKSKPRSMNLFRNI